MWDKIGHWLLGHRRWVIGFWLVFTIVMGFAGRNVTVAYDLPKMLPDDDSVMVQFTELTQEFAQNGNILVLGAKDESFFTPMVLNQWRNMALRLEQHEEITSVVSMHNALDLYMDEAQGEAMQPFPVIVGPIKSPRQAFKIQDQFEELPFYKGLLTSQDGKTHLMMVSMTDKATYSSLAFEVLDDLETEIKKFERRTGIDVNVSGLPYLRLKNARSVQSEINLFIILTGIVTVLIMLLLLRSLRAAIIALSIVGVGIAGAFGIMGLLHHPLSIFSGMIPPLLIVIAVPNCIFFVNKYHSEYIKDKAIRPAILHTVKKIGGVALLTNVTTALGFATFMMTSSVPLVRFAITSSISIIFVYLISITTLPVLYSWLSKPKERHYEHLEQAWLVRSVDWLVRVASFHRPKVYLMTVVIFLAAIAGISQLKITGNLTADFSESNPMVKQLRFFERELGGVIPLDVVISSEESGGVLEHDILVAADAFQMGLDSIDGVSRAFSMVDVMKFGHQGWMGGAERHYALPNPESTLSIVNSLPEFDTAFVMQLAHSLINDDQTKLHIGVQMKDFQYEEMTAVLDEIKDLSDATLAPVAEEVEMTGASVMFMRSTEFLVENLLVSLLLAILIIAALMAGLFRKGRMVLIAIVPNLLPLLITAGLMGWFGIPIKPSTVLTFSIAFGISVDDTLHYLARYRHELVENGGNIAKAAISAIKETGVSMFYTSVVLFAGFFIFLSSSFGGTQALGLLVSITLIFAMFTNLLILPSFLMSMDKVISAQDFKDILIDLADDE